MNNDYIVVKNIHTVPLGDIWAVKLEDEVGYLSFENSKEDAIEFGREMAIKFKVEHIIHNSDGKIAYRNSYGNDPYPPKG